MIRTTSRRCIRHRVQLSQLGVALGVLGILGTLGCHDVLAGGGDREVTPVLWRAPVLREEIWAGMPAISEPRVYVMLDYEIAAFDSRNGQPLWRTRVTRPPVWTETIIVHQGSVYVAGADSIYSLDAITGDVRWRAAPDDSTAAGAYHLVADSTLYVGTRAHRLHALSLVNGRTRWSTDLGPHWRELGTVQGISRAADTLYVSLSRFLESSGAARRGVVVAIDRRDGRELWRYETDATGSFDGPPTLAGPLLLLADTDGRAFVALDRFSGRESWRVPTDTIYLGPRRSPIVRDGIAYGVAYDGHAYAMRLADGHLVWRASVGASANHLALCGSSLLAQSQGVAVVDVATGRLRHVLFDDGDDFTTSGIVVSGRRAYTAGTRAVYAFRCG